MVTYRLSWQSSVVSLLRCAFPRLYLTSSLPGDSLNPRNLQQVMTDHVRWRMEAAEPGSFNRFVRRLDIDPRMMLYGSPLFSSAWVGYNLDFDIEAKPLAGAPTAVLSLGGSTTMLVHPARGVRRTLPATAAFAQEGGLLENLLAARVYGGPLTAQPAVNGIGYTLMPHHTTELVRSHRLKAFEARRHVPSMVLV